MSRYLRVLYEPWTSAAQSGEAASRHIVALPTIVVFDKGKETARLNGDATPDAMRSKLRF